jgi:protease II
VTLNLIPIYFGTVSIDDNARPTYDFNENKSVMLKQQEVLGGFNSSDYRSDKSWPKSGMVLKCPSALFIIGY